MSDFEYGNTRLRAQRSRLLVGPQYRALFATGTTERLLGALSATPYAPDLERTLVRHDSFHRLDEAVSHHLARTLRAMRGYYEGRARAGIDLLLSRWDLKNVRAILRAKARPLGLVDAEPMLVPAGSLDQRTLGELAAQPSLRSTVELMVAWDIPSRSAARDVLRQWPRYENTGDPVALEIALNRAWTSHTAEERSAWEGSALDHVLGQEVDALNLMTALRLRQARIEGGPAEAGSADSSLADQFLVGGRLGRSLLERIGLGSTPSDLAAVLSAHALPPDWLAALTAWSGDDDLEELGGRLERAVARDAIGLFARGDPMGIAIPVAFTWAKECEARNLRLVGRSITHGLAWDDIETEMFPA